jgi:integrase
MISAPASPTTLNRLLRLYRDTPTDHKEGNHTFRATGIKQYLRNGGRRELAQQMAAHESPRTTALYDPRDDEVPVDEVERILS